tara:strand:- start:11804 stop:11947 length:144 start_codon:yes stop_codon:yes gene_type:complete
MSKENETKENKKDCSPKVTGIGGIFFMSENPNKTREWYAENLKPGSV